jgi:hypothetical protein
MAEPGAKKFFLGTAEVFIHFREREKGTFNHHFDIHMPLLAEIAGDEKTCCGSNGCGLWVGLTKGQAERIKKIYDAIDEAHAMAECGAFSPSKEKIEDYVPPSEKEPA